MTCAQPKEIEIYLIAKTVIDKQEVTNWLCNVANNKHTVPYNEYSNASILTTLAAKRCYKSFDVSLNKNLSSVRNDYKEYLDNILSSGHGSVLEHCSFTFAIENVTRIFTAEMNRHRAGWAISEGSMRFIRFDDEIPYWVPNSIRENDSDDEDLIKRKKETRDVFSKAFGNQQELYKELLAIWKMGDTDKNFSYKKKITSMMRRIIGMGVCTGGIWTGNVRALRHVITMRCSAAAEEEILHVFSRIIFMLSNEEPELFGDFEEENGYWKPKYVKV